MQPVYCLCVLLHVSMMSISVYAGVTDGDVTAYRFTDQHEAVVFTNNPGDDPDSGNAPLGGGMYSSGYQTCISAYGVSGINGFTCNGTSGTPVKDYTCDLVQTPVASDTTWCLFSENPRTGGKAWAVRFTNGLIPTNDGASIVRCQGTDVFYPKYGCGPLPSQIGIKGGFIKLDTTEGSAPSDLYCFESAHNGRMVVDDVNNLLYICTASGWKTTPLN